MFCDPCGEKFVGHAAGWIDKCALDLAARDADARDHVCAVFQALPSLIELNGFDNNSVRVCIVNSDVDLDDVSCL